MSETTPAPEPTEAELQAAAQKAADDLKAFQAKHPHQPHAKLPGPKVPPQVRANANPRKPPLYLGQEPRKIIAKAKAELQARTQARIEGRHREHVDMRTFLTNPTNPTK